MFPYIGYWRSCLYPKLPNFLSSKWSLFTKHLNRQAHFTSREHQAIPREADSDPEPPAGTLWVDRYRPTRYLDLLGDDRTHREVMSWVKEWDYCVFGKSKGKKRARDEENFDEYRRPREKVRICSRNLNAHSECCSM